MEDTETKWGQCRFCRRFIRNFTGTMCSQCYEEMQANQRRNDPTRYRPAWVVVADPLPFSEGGYKSGAGFSSEDHQANLRNAAYTPGTLLRNVRTEKTVTV